MHLQEYMHSFLQQGINGSVLCGLDETRLASLGMSSKIHKLRLMSIIDGRTSARPFFEKDPYVQCYKP